MKKYFILLIISYFVVSCKEKIIESSTVKNNDKISHLLFNNRKVKENLANIFEINGSEKKVFKVLLSRRNNFTRITIYQLFYKSEIEEPPMGFITYNKSIFLYYCGAEMLFDDKISSTVLQNEMASLNISLKDSITNIQDSRVFQFDIFNNKDVKINFPAISPFDEDDKTIQFKKSAQ